MKTIIEGRREKPYGMLLKMSKLYESERYFSNFIFKKLLKF